MTYTDAFASWNTLTLVSIAYRVTPRHEVDRWVATADGRQWTIKDGRATATDGTRDANGVCVIVADFHEDDLRGFVIEQLDEYGTTLADVNYMKS